MASVSRVLRGEDGKKRLDGLRLRGFSDSVLKSEYEARRLTGPGTVVLYTSGKLVIQGKDAIVSEVEKIVFGEYSGSAGAAKKEMIDDSPVVRVGGDECLKGDTFGGIVVCCVKADAGIRRQLFALGVADSKKIADSKIRTMGAQVIRVLGHDNYRLVGYMPKEYNSLFSRIGSVTGILNMMYKNAVSSFSGFDECVIDQYPGLRVSGCKSFERAESKFIEVAAASVLARYFGLVQMDELSRLAGFDLPKGSTHVRWAMVRLSREGRDFSLFAKLHFRNVGEFLAKNRDVKHWE